MKITILASVGSQNLGDELILKNTVKHFEKIFGKKNTQFDICTYDTADIFFKQKNISYHEYFPIGITKKGGIRRNINNFSHFITIIKQTDIVVIGGGGLFFDNEGSVSSIKNLNTWMFRTQLIRYYKKDLFFHAIGINFQDETNLTYQKKISKIFLAAREVSVRDNFSHKYLKKLGITSKIVLDPVYNDDKKFKEKKSLQLGSLPIKDLDTRVFKNIDIKNKTVGFALRALNAPGYEKAITEVLEYMIQKGAKIIILPHSFHPDDPESNDFLFFQKLFSTYYHIEETSTQISKIQISHSLQETYNFYTEKKLDLILASRLHSIILAKVYKIPYVGLSYSRKTEEQL